MAVLDKESFEKDVFEMIMTTEDPVLNVNNYQHGLFLLFYTASFPLSPEKLIENLLNVKLISITVNS